MGTLLRAATDASHRRALDVAPVAILAASGHVLGMLTSKQRAFLAALAHDKKPVVLLGHKGLSDAVVTETKAALLAHELIKVRLAQGDELDDDATAIATSTGAELVDRLGRVVILYRAHPDKPKIKLPKKKKGLFDVRGDGEGG